MNIPPLSLQAQATTSWLQVTSSSPLNKKHKNWSKLSVSLARLTSPHLRTKSSTKHTFPHALPQFQAGGFFLKNIFSGFFSPRAAPPQCPPAPTASVHPETLETEASEFSRRCRAPPGPGTAARCAVRYSGTGTSGWLSWALLWVFLGS